MSRPRSIMRKIKEVLRLTFGEGLSRRQVSQATALPYTTVSDHLARARRAGIGCPLPEGLDDAAFEARLFTRATLPATAARPLPDWAEVHRELRSRKDVTLQLLHLEIQGAASDGDQYSQFCRHYHAWRRTVDLVVRQEHRAGERCFVDWAGQSVPIIDPATGEIALERAYEAVRAQATGTVTPVTPRGLALIIYSGLPAWIRAWASLAQSEIVAPAPTTTAPVGPSAELVSVLAEMALGGQRSAAAWTA